VIKRTTPTEDRVNAERLEEHVRNLTSTNQERTRCSWFDRRLDVPTFLLAVSGAVVWIAVVLAALWPLAKISFKYWTGA